MCGRLFGTTDAHYEKVQLRFNLNRTVPKFLNVGPTDRIAVIHNGANGYRINPMRWAFSPLNHRPTHLARIETVTSLPSFCEAARVRRGVIPVSGFIEWKHDGKNKQPYYFSSIYDAPIFLAAIWDILPGNQLTCSLLTKPADVVVSKIHERMPVVLDADQAENWMSNSNTVNKLISRVLHFPIALRCIPVSSAINNVCNKIRAEPL